MKSFSILFKEVRWSVALMLVIGIAIGAVGTWLVFDQIDRFYIDDAVMSVQKSQATPSEEVTSIDAVKDVEIGKILEFEKIDPVTLSKKSALALFSRVSTNTEMLMDFFSTVDEVSVINKEEGYTMHTVSEIVNDVWQVGTMTSDPFKGDKVYLVKSQGLEGMMISWFEYNVVIFDESEQRFYILEKERQDEWAPMENSVYSLFAKTSYLLSGLDMPAEVELDNGKIVTGGETIEGTYNEKKDTLHLIGKTKDGQAVYGDANSCVFILDAVGRLIRYESAITSSARSDMPMPKSIVTWNQGIEPTNNEFNSYQWSGCGYAFGCTLLAEQVVEDDLVEIGKTVNGDSVYAPKNLIEDDVTIQIYDTWFTFDESKPSIEEMLKRESVPFFYWKDAFDRWVRYNNSSLMPMAECGKPVIYLYPEKKMSVRVSLPSFINVTVSEPTYPKKGWSVTASPNGDLVSKADGKTYGSLFWEGTGVGYQSPTSTGFVIKSGEAKSFLAETLPKYGLNQKETAEFMDFWVPRMASSSYYLVSFLTDEWSQSAPLLVSPQPKTNIRIFMDLKPLSAPISIAEPVIKTPVRDGFTLVEWGGLLLKSQ